MLLSNCSNTDNIRLYRLLWRYGKIHEIGTEITIPSFIYIYLLYFPFYGLFATYRFDCCAVLTKSVLCFGGPTLLAAVLWHYSKNPKLARLLYTNRGSFAMLFHFSSSDCHNKCRCRV